MDQKLEALVNEVDQKARKYASFDDFLEAQDKEKPEWEKATSAAAVVESSPSTTSAKEDATVESANPSNAEAVTPPTRKPQDVDPRRKAMESPSYIQSGLKSETLAHPVAPQVEGIEGQDPWKKIEAQVINTRYELHQVEWDKDKLTYLSAPATVQENDPEWWREIYLGGVEYARALETPEAIVTGMNTYQERIEKLNRAIQGMRGVLEEKLHGVSSERREKLLAKNSRFKANQNTAAATRMKTERKTGETKAATPKGNGIKLAKAMAEMSKNMRGDKLIAYLKEQNLCDDVTVEYVQKAWAK